ncbi:hypothetical protein C6497_04180 [Candidatus Poribacteria bacterium]|nr:MAG: hypothetical protein C6497_04180 [Candidatus Poribacteria bacterium]
MKINSFHAKRFIILVSILSIFMTTCVYAQFYTKEMSGRVITPNGEPISDLDIGIGVIRSTTDSNGRFTIKNVDSRHSQFYIFDNIKIRSIKFGNIAFYYHGRNEHESLNFTFRPGSNIDNIEVITTPQIRINGQIVFKDGKPLADASIQTHFDTLSIESDIGYRYKKTLQTDAQGNFENIVITQGVYVISIKYRGLTGESTPFLVNQNIQHEPIVLTLDGDPDDLNEPETAVANINSSKNYYGVPDIPGVWIVNPQNGHAYKWVKCKDWIDAKVIAEEENVNLVSITSEEEQIWLESVFKGRAYWIGLTDSIQEGKWEWVTGEPVTYSNWSKNKDVSLQLTQTFPSVLGFMEGNGDINNHEDEIHDYAILFIGNDTWGNVSGKWVKAHNTGGRGVGQVSMAILEKELD